MSFIKEWFWFNRERLAAAGVLALAGAVLGFSALLQFLGYRSITVVVLLIPEMYLFRLIFTNWSRWFSYQEKPPEFNIPDRDDPEAEHSLALAVNRLSSEYRDVLEKNNIVIEIIHDDAQWINYGVPHAVYTVFGDGRKKITIYSYVMRKYQEQESMTPEAFDDWMYRILLHEIGHAVGRSDKDMAEISGY